MKKALKISGIVIGSILLLLVSVPFLFKETIKEKIVESVNKNLNAQVHFGEVSVSLLKNFPQTTVSIQDVKIINNAPFEGDTLLYSKELSLKVNLKNLLFKSENEPYKLLGFSAKNTRVNIRMNNEGKGNFDITKTSEENKEQTDLSLDINEYSIENLRFTFKDDKSKNKIILDSLFHNGKGDFSSQILDLQTDTKAKVTFISDKNTFVKNTPISLNAILGIDLNNQKYTFKDNKLLINNLALIFKGDVHLMENGQKYNLSFNTPSTSFENFLNLLPQTYTKDIKGVKTTGNFIVNGKINGIYSKKNIPKLDISLLSKNASFKYPNLPKAVKNINIDIKIGNDTEILNDTYVTINHFSFTIDKDHFSATSNIKNITENPVIQANINGNINLANLKQAYPIKNNLDIKGVLKAHINTAFDMASVENKKYENIKNSGDLSLENFTYSGKEIKNPLQISKAGLNFNSSKVKITEFSAKTGKSDFSIKGELDNFYGFIFKNEELKGNFNLESNTLSVNDFMETQSQSTSENNTENQQKTANTSAMKIPSFLNCTLTAKANSVIYDNLTLKNVSGKLEIHNQKADLQNLKFNLFQGQVTLNGNVSTKNAKPSFQTTLNLNKISILESFTQIKMLEKIAPIQKAIQGFLSTNISVQGFLNSDMTPDLSTIKGNLNALLSDAKVKENGTPLLSLINQQFPKLNLANLQLNDIKISSSFENGRVIITPFDVKFGRSGTIKIEGTHGFDQSMNYHLALNVPANMLGGDIEKTLSKLSATEQQNLPNILLPVTVTGDFNKPKISADVKKAVGNLTQHIIQGQANKLIDKGVEKGLDALGNLLGGGKISSDSTKTQQKDQVKKAVGNLLNGLFNRKKDTISQK